MALLEIFRSKPRWLHSDPDVRAEAVRALGAGEQGVLAGVARTDTDARVRRLAARKLAGVEILAEIARTDADVTVRNEACEALQAAVMGEGEPDALRSALDSIVEPKALASLAKAARLEPVRRAALTKLDDPKMLAQVAREAVDGPQRLAALQRITDAALRASVAVGSEHRDVALAALESIDERGMLKTIAARAKIKAVARRARALLNGGDSGAEPLPAAERHARQSQVCRTIEALAHAKDLAQAAEQLAAAEASWQDLGPCSDAALAARYDAALRVVRAGLARHESDARERERLGAEQQTALAQRRALCEEIEALLAGEDVHARLEAARTSWGQLTPLAHPEADELARRFAQAVEACRVRMETGAAAAERETKREELCREAEALAAAEEMATARPRFGAIEKEWRAVSAGLEDEKSARFVAARARYEEREGADRAARAQKEQQNLARLVSLAERLETLAAAAEPSLKEATRCLREAGTVAAEPGPLPSRRERETLLARIEAARKKLYPQVQALRADEDWKRWANLSVREALCQEIEALVAVENLDEVARRVKDIDARWKTAGELPREQGEALRERFRASRDAVAARLQTHFARIDAERAENLSRKQALCERAEALAESTDWARTAEAVRKLQEEWQAIGPVSREHSDAVWRRFRAACEHFFTRFKAHRQARSAEWAANQERKQALCERAEALAESSDWDKTLSEVRALQDEWKKVGAVRRSQSEALWKRFRTACDAFFERHKRREEITAAANTAACEELCRQIEALLPAADPGTPPPDALAEKIGTLRDAWRKASRALGASASPLVERFERACLALVEAFPTSFAGTELDPQLTLRKMEKLCGRVETLVAQCAPAAGGVSADDLARQLQSALAANAMGGQAEREVRWRSGRDEVEEAHAAWKRLGPVPAALGEPLAERFRVACESFFALRPGATRDTRHQPGGRTR
jgi:hypothetical protein